MPKDTVFVISEFNPFHHGHQYLIDTLKKEFETVVCVMSGNAVQRGEPACAEKYLRAKIAVENGVNLVFELPFPFCSLSAADFAYAGVYLVNALRGANLAFGTESPGEDLESMADILYDKEKIYALIKSAPELSFPKAGRALLESVNPRLAPLIQRPNNILAVEYLNAIKAISADIQPVYIKRETRYASSTQIRKVLRADFGAGLKMLPETTSRLLSKENLWQSERLDGAILAFIRLTEGKGDVYGIGAGDFAKIYHAALSSSSAGELGEKCVSPTLTYARIRRALLFALLGVGKEYGHGFSAEKRRMKTPGYALLLAADKKGRAYIARGKKDFAVPVITKPADYAAARGPAWVPESDQVKKDFAFSLKADRVLSLASGQSGRYNPLTMTPAVDG